MLHAPNLSPRPANDAARVGLCASVPGHFAPHPMRCSALVPVPAALRTPRARLVPRGLSDTNLRCTPPERGQSDGPARRIAAMPTALLRRPKRARAMIIPVYDADARPPSPARSQIQNKVGRGIRRGSSVMIPAFINLLAARLPPPPSPSPPYPPRLPWRPACEDDGAILFAIYRKTVERNKTDNAREGS